MKEILSTVYAVFIPMDSSPVVELAATKFLNWTAAENLAAQILGIQTSEHVSKLTWVEISHSGRLAWIPNEASQVNENVFSITGMTDIRGDAVAFFNSMSSKQESIAKLRMKCQPGSGILNRLVNKTEIFFPDKSLAVRSQVFSTIHVLPSNVMLSIFSELNFTDLCSCTAVCQSWRNIVLNDEHLLVDLPIQHSSLLHKNATLVPLLDESIDFGKENLQHNMPALVLKAAEFGNVEAMVLVADDTELRGQKMKSLDWRRKAARKGHQASQYYIGEAYYRGEGDCLRDSEEALAWLLKSFKNPHEEKKWQAASALLLGYMYLDGDGTQKADNTEASKWFQIAISLGSMEAQMTMGWLWNTGQY